MYGSLIGTLSSAQWPSLLPSLLPYTPLQYFSARHPTGSVFRLPVYSICIVCWTVPVTQTRSIALTLTGTKRSKYMHTSHVFINALSQILLHFIVSPNPGCHKKALTVSTHIINCWQYKVAMNCHAKNVARLCSIKKRTATKKYLFDYWYGVGYNDHTAGKHFPVIEGQRLYHNKQIAVHTTLLRYC